MSAPDDRLPAAPPFWEFMAACPTPDTSFDWKNVQSLGDRYSFPSSTLMETTSTSSVDHDHALALALSVVKRNEARRRFNRWWQDRLVTEPIVTPTGVEALVSEAWSAGIDAYLGVHIDTSEAADAARMRWLLDGHGYFMEEEGLCGHDPTEKEKLEARLAIDEAMKPATPQ